MRKLEENKIITGTAFMPILPFIYNSEENIEAVIRKTKESGGEYALDGGANSFWLLKDTFLQSP